MIERFGLEMLHFRAELERKGYSAQAVEQKICQVADQLALLVNATMQDGTREAVLLGFEKKSPEFINDLKPDPESFRLTTFSGKTDFSTPSFDMKDYLLRNAPTSKDGVRYKVIPVGAPPKQMKLMPSSMEVERLTAQNLRDELDALRAKRGQTPIKRKPLKPEFRTVTDRAPADSWINPGKEADFTNELDDLNERLYNRIRMGLQDIIENNLKTDQGEFSWDS